MPDINTTYLVKDFKFSDLSTVFILKHSAGPADTTASNFFDLQPDGIEINSASFSDPDHQIKFPRVELILAADSLLLICGCAAVKNRLCEHQARVMYNVMQREEIRIFFDEQLRHRKIRQFAVAYGLENEKHPDDLFNLSYENRKTEITPVMKDLLPVTTEKNNLLKDYFGSGYNVSLPKLAEDEIDTRKILVLKQHKYYTHFMADLTEAALSTNGKIRNPLQQLNAMDFIWDTEDPAEIKFYTAISKFQYNYESEKNYADKEGLKSEIEGLKALVKNPLQLDVFYHNAKKSPNITASSIVPVTLKNLKIDISLAVNLTNGFYTISGELILENKTYDLKMLNILFKYFILYNEILYLIDSADSLRVIDF